MWTRSSNRAGLPARALLLTLLLMGLSCAATPPSGYRYGGSGYFYGPVLGDPEVTVEVFAEHHELDEIESEIAFSNGSDADVDLDDRDRDRAGLRVRFGAPELAGFVTVFGEEFDLVEDEGDAGGLGLGVIGDVVLAPLTDDLLFLGHYRGQLNFVSGETDVSIFDRRTGARVSRDEEDFYYTEVEADVGFSLEYLGVRAGAGVYVSDLFGEIEVPGPDLELEGTNGALYLRLGFAHPDSWVIADVLGFFGDVEGFTASVGIRF